MHSYFLARGRLTNRSRSIVAFKRKIGVNTFPNPLETVGFFRRLTEFILYQLLNSMTVNTCKIILLLEYIKERPISITSSSEAIF